MFNIIKWLRIFLLIPLCCRAISYSYQLSEHANTITRPRNTINKHFSWIFAFLLLLSSASAHAQDPVLTQVIKNVQERYEQTNDLEASFIQEATIKSVNQTVTETGVVYFKKPQRMLWDYHTPSQKKLVINPEKAWLYVPEDNLVYVQDAQKILSSKMTVRFMMGVGKLQDDFQISFAGPNKIDANGYYDLCLLPRSKELGIEKLFMKVHKDTFFIMNFSFADMYGNTTKLTFSDMKTNMNLSDSIFTFTPPPGVNLYHVP